MMKILLICNYKPDKGGISHQVELLKNKLNDEDYIADIYSVNGNFLKRIKFFLQLLSKGKQYDLFHIHACSGRGFLPVVIGYITGLIINKPYIITYHGGDLLKFVSSHLKLVKFFVERSRQLIVLNLYQQEVFAKFGIESVVIPNIIDFDESNFNKRYTISPAFISVRHLRELYNIECIIKAFALFKKKYETASLTILGEGPLRAELESLVTELNISGVTFVGVVPNREVVSYLNQSDVFLTSPLIDNMPISVLEAFNSGLLVISSNVGGIPYLINNQRNGLLFKSNDAVDLSEKMFFAIEHQKESIRMIENAYHDIQKYSWKNIRVKILTIYSKICGLK